jgi:hypothetical protein
MSTTTQTPDPDPDTLSISELPMPRLSDDAVVQIHDFLHHVFDLFEARYGDQIHRFYEGLRGDFIDPDMTEGGADPDF